MKNDSLLDVIDRLTIEHPFPAVIDGRTRWVRRDPLIRQLREAIASSLTGGNGTKAQASPVPFDTDAQEKYDALEDAILSSFVEVRPDRVPELLPEQNLRAWFAAVRGTLEGDPESENRWTAYWSMWENRIVSKLEVPVVLELIDVKSRRPFECPDCGMDWFEKILNSGPDGRGGRWYDREKRVALTATYRPDGVGGLDRSAVECGCCGWRVTGSGVRGFAWDLERQEDVA